MICWFIFSTESLDILSLYGGSLKIGDLVELSAYGKKLKCLKKWHGDTGLVIGNNLVMWSTAPGFNCLVNDRDVKKVKK